MIDGITIDWIILLFFISIFASIVDSIAGGGALIVIPTLSLIGINPIATLATSKLQASFGVASASFTYYRNGLIDLSWIKYAALLCFIASIIGSLSVLKLNAEFLTLIIPFLLIIISLYFLFSPSLDQPLQKSKLSIKTYTYFLCPLIGWYDGFFGPGTGSFLTIAHRAGLGMMIKQAIAHAKPLNFITNLASLIVFLFSGKTLIMIGLIMGCGQIIGGYIGAQLASHFGGKLIKPIMIIISLSLAGKLLLNQFS